MDLFQQDENGDTVLHQAARDGRLFAFDDITDESLRIKNTLGDTPVHEAALYGCLDQITHVLNDSHLLEKNSTHSTPLHYAAANGHLPQIQRFLSLATLCAEDGRGQTPVAIGIANGYWETKEVVQELLINEKGPTPLFVELAETGKIEKLAHVLDARMLNAKVSTPSFATNGLHIAARAGYLHNLGAFFTAEDLLKADGSGNSLLCDAAAKPNGLLRLSQSMPVDDLRDALRSTAPGGEIHLHHPSIVKRLGSIPDVLTTEMLLSRNTSNETTFSLIIDQGAMGTLPQKIPVDVLFEPDSNGNTYFSRLFEKRKAGHLPSMTAADMTRPVNEAGTTLICAAAISGYLKQFASVITPDLLCLADKDGSTPIHHAFNEKGADLDFVAKVLEPKMLVMQNKSGDTPLHHAARNSGHLAKIMAKTEPALFLMRNNAGETPVHWIVKHKTYSKPETVAKLPKAAFSMADNEGRLPAHYIAQNYSLLSEFKSVLTKKMLLTPDNAGVTPSEHAIGFNYFDMFADCFNSEDITKPLLGGQKKTILSVATEKLQIISLSPQLKPSHLIQGEEGQSLIEKLPFYCLRVPRTTLLPALEEFKTKFPARYEAIKGDYEKGLSEPLPDGSWEKLVEKRAARAQQASV